MNLILYFATKIFGYPAFSTVTTVIMIISIISSIVLIFAVGSWSNIIWAIAKTVILIIFFKTGFPANAVLITFLVLDGIGCVLIFADLIGGGINIASEILNIIGFFLFRAAFL